MSDPAVCPKCGGKMDDGMTHESWFVRAKSFLETWFTGTPNVETIQVCLDCGFVEVYVDPRKLRRRRRDEE